MVSEERLQEAIKGGEILKITYQGGSQPGTFREIAPISIKDGKLIAKCLGSNTVKTFALEQIVIVDWDEKDSDHCAISPAFG